jgi:DNA-binding transcriptional LysR family regulator
MRSAHGHVVRCRGAAHTPRVDLHHLRCFLAVAEELNFGRAAERLHLTPSPVSRAVRDLERELGTPLFVRGHHSISLTPAGELLAGRGASVLADFARLRPEVERFVAAARRRVRLGGSPLVASEVLDAVVESAGRAHPEAEVLVELGSVGDLVSALESGDLDVAVVHLPLDAPDIASRPLVHYRMCIAVRADDGLAQRAELVLADLAGRTVAMLPPAPRSLTISRLRLALEQGGVTRINVLLDDDVLRLAEHVRRTGEPTPAFRHGAGGAARVLGDPAFALVPVADGPTVAVGLAWRADRTADDVVSALVSAATGCFACGDAVA